MISKIHYIYYLFSLFRPAILTNFVEIIRLPISGCTIPEKTSCSVYGWGYTGCKKLFLKTKWIRWELTSSCHYRWGCWYCLMPRLSNSFCYKMQFQFFSNFVNLWAFYLRSINMKYFLLVHPFFFFLQWQAKLFKHFKEWTSEKYCATCLKNLAELFCRVLTLFWKILIHLLEQSLSVSQSRPPCGKTNTE